MTQNKKLIAITGGIGSGKSSVAKILKDFGYKVFSCDKIYVDLLNQGYFNKEFAKNFGKVFNEDGSLNKKLLAQSAENKRQERAWKQNRCTGWYDVQ